MIVLHVPSYVLKLEVIPYLTRNPQLATRNSNLLVFSNIPAFQRSKRGEALDASFYEPGIQSNLCGHYSR